MLDNMMLRYDIERVKSAISRNLEEVNSALLKLTAYIKLCEIDIACVGMSFFAIAGKAMYNDMLVNVFRALDLRTNVDSFWYVERIIPVEVRSAAKSCNADIKQVKEFSAMLLYVRNKTSVHIDKSAVEDSRAVWHKAGISGDEFIRTLYSVAGILAKLEQELLGYEPIAVTSYDGSDIPKIVAAYEKVYGKLHGVIPNS